MKQLIGVGRTMLGLMALVGCSADGERGGSISFYLLSSPNVQIDSIDYDISTQPGTEVVSGSIPLPDKRSVLGIQSLSSGDYALTLSATGKLPDGASVQCKSLKTPFHVTSGANTPIGEITLTCTISTPVDMSASGSIDDVTVTCISCGCGDGLLETGEQCDPPNGTTCSSTCQNVGPSDRFTSLCVPCIAASPDGVVQATYCDPSSTCLGVEKCVVNSACFNPIPAFCYCGTTDVTACDAATFVPTGPCHTEIRAGEPTAASNDDALNQLFDFTVPTGIAMDILNDVQVNVPECQTACF